MARSGFGLKIVHQVARQKFGSVLISERGIYAASTFKAIRSLKRAKARAPSANQDTAKKFLQLFCGRRKKEPSPYCQVIF
jgi:hypothetical protein